MKKVKIFGLVVVLVLIGWFGWWSLGYRADNCHGPDMSRGQQFICDNLGGRR